MRKPEPKFPFIADCVAEVLGERVPARFLGLRSLSRAWVQLEKPAGVFAINRRDLKFLESVWRPTIWPETRRAE